MADNDPKPEYGWMKARGVIDAPESSPAEDVIRAQRENSADEAIKARIFDKLWADDEMYIGLDANNYFTVDGWIMVSDEEEIALLKRMADGR